MTLHLPELLDHQPRQHLGDGLSNRDAVPVWRQEFRDWLNAGMPDHPLFSKSTNPARAAATAGRNIDNGRGGRGRSTSAEINDDASLHAQQGTDGEFSHVAKDVPETENA